MNGICWRCDAQEARLVNDPLMPMTDRIGVCQSCADARRETAIRYRRFLGMGIKPTYNEFPA